MSNRMTRKLPLCCPEVVCDTGKSFDIYQKSFEPPVVTGTIIDRLYEYEEIGTPEYFRKLANRDKLEQARKLNMNSIFGGYGSMLKIGEEDQMKAIENLDISRMYPKTMFTIDTKAIAKYIEADVEATALLHRKVNPYIKKDKPALPEIDHVIFNNPATIVFWKDDTKTVVKVNTGEPYDPEKGLAMAMVKKVSGNKGNYYNTIRKELDKIPYDINEVCHIEGLESALHCLNQCGEGVNDAYGKLSATLRNKKATKADLIDAITYAVGRLGELKECN